MSKYFVAMKDAIEEEIVETRAIDSEVEPKVNDKLIDTIFKPVASSQTPYCIHTSRSITC